MDTSSGHLLSYTTQAVPVQALFQRQSDTHRTNYYEHKNPGQKGERSGHFQWDAEQLRQHNHRRHLNPAPDSRDLDGRSERNEAHEDQNIYKIKSYQPGEGLRQAPVAGRDQEPLDHRIHKD